MDLTLLKLGALVTTKKPHPCGGSRWEVVRTGADWKIKCLTCGRAVMLEKDALVKRLKSVEECV